MAAADAVAMATAIATNKTAVSAGVQQICDCSGLSCCQGGWPEDAFAWMVANGNITTNANYNYFALDGRTCTLKNPYPTAGNITGWERVPSHSTAELKKAVTMQPVLVYISASSDDFLRYSSGSPTQANFSIYDGACTSEVNHALLVVGYNTATNYGGSKASVDYWILKNSWPDFGWGDKGYMYIRMLDGAGKCGMQTVNPIFPTYFPFAPMQATVKSGSTVPVLATDSYWWSFYASSSSGSGGKNDPCVGVINPCGGGTCYRDSSDGIVLARCKCPAGFTEMVGVPTSKCVDVAPCNRGQFNPCGAGSCTNVGDGSYYCSCNSGYVIGTLVNGAPTCIPGSATSVAGATYVTGYGDTCAKIQSAYGITSTTFAAMNPYLVCGKLLLPGITVRLPASVSKCKQLYAVQSSDSCSTVSSMVSTSTTTDPTLSVALAVDSDTTTTSSLSTSSSSTLLQYNPTLDCTALYKGELVCLKTSTDTTSAAPCGQTYQAVDGDTCATVPLKFALTSSAFLLLNPGLNCSFNGGLFSPGTLLCIAARPVTTVVCTQNYTVQQGDSCSRIWNAANISQFQLLTINPGLQCQAPFLYVGLQVCIDSPLLATISDPSFVTYSVQVGDSWGIIQSQFSSKCKSESVSILRIAGINGLNTTVNWFNSTPPVGMLLTIPCVPKVGATCGCATSLPVCGSNFVNYASYCDARCNFATPVTSGTCSACQNACAGRYGDLPVPASACPGNATCNWPLWPPTASDASAVYTTSPLCNYRRSLCTGACASYNVLMGYASSDTYCFNTCMACQRVPCSGPSEIVDWPSFYCNTCSVSGCTSAAGGLCATVCSYWNARWSPLNP